MHSLKTATEQIPIKIQIQNKMPKCPLASHPEMPISKQGKYKVQVKLEYLIFYFLGKKK